MQNRYGSEFNRLMIGDDEIATLPFIVTTRMPMGDQLGVSDPAVEDSPAVGDIEWDVCRNSLELCRCDDVEVGRVHPSPNHVRPFEGRSSDLRGQSDMATERLSSCVVARLQGILPSKAKGVAVQFKEEPWGCVSNLRQQNHHIVEVLVAGSGPSPCVVTGHCMRVHVGAGVFQLLDCRKSIGDTGRSGGEGELVILPAAEFLEDLNPLLEEVTVTLADRDYETHCV
jgi:hypothetical protein